MAVLDLSVNIYSIISDNGDGGFTANVYNDSDELVKDHPLYEDNQECDTHEILDMIEDDGYDNGYLAGYDTVNFVIKFNPSISEEQVEMIRKAITEIKIEPFSFSGGQ